MNAVQSYNRFKFSFKVQTHIQLMLAWVAVYNCPPTRDFCVNRKIIIFDVLHEQKIAEFKFSETKIKSSFVRTIKSGKYPGLLMRISIIIGRAIKSVIDVVPTTVITLSVWHMSRTDASHLTDRKYQKSNWSLHKIYIFSILCKYARMWGKSNNYSHFNLLI